MLLLLPAALHCGQNAGPIRPRRTAEVSMKGIFGADGARMVLLSQFQGSSLLLRTSFMRSENEGHLYYRSTRLDDSAGSSDRRGLRIVKSAGFGIVGGAVGFGLGSLAVGATSHPQGEDAGLALLAGGAIGVPIVFPIGVHLGNECRGSLAMDYAPLVVTGAGAFMLGRSGNLHSIVPLIILGVADLVGTIVIEQLTSH
jgi:hypothetical protein